MTMRWVKSPVIELEFGTYKASDGQIERFEARKEDDGSYSILLVLDDDLQKILPMMPKMFFGSMDRAKNEAEAFMRISENTTLKQFEDLFQSGAEK